MAAEQIPYSVHFPVVGQLAQVSDPEEPLDAFPFDNVHPLPGITPNSGEVMGEPESIRLLNASFASRSAAELKPGVRGEDQEIARKQSGAWLEASYPETFGRNEKGGLNAATTEDYCHIAETAEESMLGKFLAHLEGNLSSPMSPEEVTASWDFLHATFSIHSDVKQGVDLSMGDGNNRAFVVPVRLSRRNEYAGEFYPYMPAMRYVPEEMVSAFLRDLPTFIADRYVNGGHVVVAPITTDMQEDLGAVKAIPIARTRVNAAVDTARALGAVDIGYGATLPGVMKWGEATKNKAMTTTTGHGGTTALMSMMIDKIVTEGGYDRDNLRIGILGLGAIGLPAAQVIAELFPRARVSVFDTAGKNMTRLVDGSAHPDRFSLQENAEDVVTGSDITISTATSTFDFKDSSNPNYLPVKSLEDRVIIDDSEPRSFPHDQVVALGGLVFDVIGQASSNPDFTVERGTDAGYGHTLAEGSLDAFGCELEVAAMNHLRRQMLEDPEVSEETIDAVIDRYAIRGPVTADDTRRWINLFRILGVGPAAFQAFGTTYDLKTVAA